MQNNTLPTIYAISSLLKIQGIVIKDLPVSKPTYYDLVYKKRKAYAHTVKRLCDFLNVSKEYLDESLEMEKKLLKAKKKK